MVLYELIIRQRRRIKLLALVLALGVVVSLCLVAGIGVSAAPPEPIYHDLHVKDQGLDCEGCHAPNLTIARDACQECHDSAEVEGLVKQFTDQVTQIGLPPPPPDHTQDFRRGHGPFASVDPTRCTRCHQERHCQDCHEGVNLQGNIHPLNFRDTHRFEAEGNEQDCLVCHESRQFCVDCHQQERLLPHPLGSSWANTEGGAHTTEAAMNLETCLACHDLGSADPVCTRPGCHDTAGGD